VTPDEVDRGRAALERKHLNAQTVKHYLAVLRHLFELARRRWNVVRANPILQVEMPTVKRRARRIPDTAERQKLVEVAEPHVRRLIIAAMYTGLREGAIMRLSAEHFAESMTTIEEDACSSAFSSSGSKRTYSSLAISYPFTVSPRGRYRGSDTPGASGSGSRTSREGDGRRRPASWWP
jgi:site-specific recombinase XerC